MIIKGDITSQHIDYKLHNNTYYHLVGLGLLHGYPPGCKQVSDHRGGAITASEEALTAAAAGTESSSGSAVDHGLQQLQRRNAVAVAELDDNGLRPVVGSVAQPVVPSTV